MLSFSFCAGEEDSERVVSSGQAGLAVVGLRENDRAPASTFSQELGFPARNVLR